MSETFTRYGSNITNVWQKILTPMTGEVVHEKQGRSDGGCIGIPKKISNRFVHVWDINTCFEIAMKSKYI